MLPLLPVGQNWLMSIVPLTRNRPMSPLAPQRLLNSSRSMAAALLSASAAILIVGFEVARDRHPEPAAILPELAIAEIFEGRHTLWSSLSFKRGQSYAWRIGRMQEDIYRCCRGFPDC